MTDEHPLRRIEPLVLVAIGGFAGANLRYVFGILVPGRLGGTLAANALGSFLLGVVLYEAIYTGLVSRQARTVVATGFLSSFTTYSTFAVESAQSTPAVLVANVAVTYTLGVAGVLAGRALARRIAGDTETGSGDASAERTGRHPGGDP